MNKRNLYITNIVLILAVIMCGSCTSRYITTIWKNDHAFPGNYNKILVAGIFNNTDTSLRAEVETHFKKELESIGYTAVSSFGEFGAAGLKDLGQEETFIRLCNKGIDAVMTVTMIDRSVEDESEPLSAYTNPVKYYYERIWHYKQQQDNLANAEVGSSLKYSWEMILFDLSTLQPHYIIQTRTAEENIRQAIQKEFWKSMIKRLRKDKFLKSRPPVLTGPKAF